MLFFYSKFFQLSILLLHPLQLVLVFPLFVSSLVLYTLQLFNITFSTTYNLIYHSVNFNFSLSPVSLSLYLFLCFSQYCPRFLLYFLHSLYKLCCFFHFSFSSNIYSYSQFSIIICHKR